MTTPDVTLLPCPFCSGEAYWPEAEVNMNWIGCKICGASAGGPNEEAWNTRTPAAAPDGLVERVASAIRNAKVGYDSDQQTVDDALADGIVFDQIDDAATTIYEAGLIMARAAIAAMPAPDLVTRKFAIGDMVRKTKGAQWTGHVVGFYSTSLTPIGYAVESVNEPGSVQIYPEAALERA